MPTVTKPSPQSRRWAPRSTERPQNPFVGLALKLGLLGRGSRDIRKLANFNNFERVERKLLKFYGKAQTSEA